MPRLILTFETLFRVLAADKLLRDQILCRPTPTPPNLSSSICGMSIEILDGEGLESALALLSAAGNEPTGVHRID